MPARAAAACWHGRRPRVAARQDPAVRQRRRARGGAVAVRRHAGPGSEARPDHPRSLRGARPADPAGRRPHALVAYAGAAFTVAPLTDDRRTVLNLLRVLRPDVMPVPGNDAAAGIAQAVALLEQAHVQGGEIVLVTDTADAAAIRAARAAHARGIRVDVLGIGTAAGAPVPRSDGG